MWGAEQSQWQQVTNPATGRPFESYDAYQSWATGQESQGAAGSKAMSGATTPMSASAPGAGASDYNWGATTSAPTGQTDATYVYPQNIPDNAGYIGFMGPDGRNGYIDPKTGRITFTTPASGDNDPNAWMGNMAKGATATGQQQWYDPSADYGLGADYAGVIPLAHDANGTPTLFYAATPGGGGKTFTDISAAQEAAAAYRTWKLEQNARGTGAAGGGKNSTGGGAQTTGLLGVPGEGENFFDLTKQDYLKGPQRADRAFGDRPTQPTESEQYWNSWAGKFQNPDSLKEVYDRAERNTQTTLDRKASSSGWADSSAAAKATANIGVNFNDAYVKALQDYATTGMGLASASDAAHRGQTDEWLKTVDAAKGIDQQQLAFLTGGQASAGSAQSLEQDRLTGGFDRSLAIANNMAMLAGRGLEQASQESLALKMADLDAQMRLGAMDYNVAAAELNEYMATLGISTQMAGSIAQAWAGSHGKTGTVTGPLPS